MDALRRSLALQVSVGLAAAGCHAPLDTDRQPVDTGTFGNTVLTLVCKRLSYLDSLAAFNAGTSNTVDVSGGTYRDVCRLGLAPPADAPTDLKALEARRDNLTPAVDAIFPETFLPNLQGLLTTNDFLSTYDDDTAVHAIDGLVGMLHLFGNDKDATAALERFGTRLGYRPVEPALGAIRVAVNYPGLHDLLLSLTNAVTPGGSAKDEWDHLIAAAGFALRDAQVAQAPADSQRTSRLAVDLLLTQSNLLGSPDKAIPLVRRDERGLAEVAVDGKNAPVAPFVDMDGDGYADTDAVGRFVDASGKVLDVPTPFQGAPDVTPPSWPGGFDATGRPTDAKGNLIYDYVDIDKTVLAALSRDGVKLFDPSKGTAFDLARGASALMGPRVDATHTYDGVDANGVHPTLGYRGYDLSQSALLDMAYGYMQILKDPNIYFTLVLARTLVVDHEAEASRIAEAVIQAARKGDAHPEASIPANAPMWDDLIPVIRQIVNNPALTKSLLIAMEQPQVAELGNRFKNFMQYKDSFTYNASTQAVVGAFTQMVDRAQIDQGNNRSLFQRILLLIADSNGAVAENKAGTSIPTPIPGVNLNYNQGALFHVPNLATFFVQSIAYAKNGNSYVCEDANGQAFDGKTNLASTPAGCASFGSGWRAQPKANFNYNWSNGGLGGATSGSINLLGGDGYLESQTGITGMRTHPTPEALGRVLFLNPWPNNNYLSNITDPIKDRNGNLFINKHNGSLPVWEKDNFYAQLQPIAQAFADNNQEQLFIDFLVVLNKHWASKESIDTQTANPSGADWVWGSKAVSYEPLIIDMLQDGTLMHAIVDSAPVLDKIDVTVGNTTRKYPDVVQAAAAYVLNPQADLKNRAGLTTSTTADGKPVAQLSPWQILADAYVVKKGRLGIAGAEGQAWIDAVSNVIDVLFRGDNVQGVGWRFRNPRVRGVSQALINFVIVRILTHEVGSNDKQAWLTTDLPQKLQDTLANPLFAGVADFIVSLEATPETRQQLESLMVYLTNEVQYDDTFKTNLTSVGDLLQLALDDEDLVPIARVAGEAIRPERGWLDAHLQFVKRARASDTNQALVQIARNLYTEHRPGHTAIGDVIDGISEVLRANPYTDLEQHYTAADYASLLNGVANFLDENRRGLRKFVRIIQTRNVD